MSSKELNEVKNASRLTTGLKYNKKIGYYRRSAESSTVVVAYENYLNSCFFFFLLDMVNTYMYVSF